MRRSLWALAFALVACGEDAVGPIGDDAADTRDVAFAELPPLDTNTPDTQPEVDAAEVADGAEVSDVPDTAPDVADTREPPDTVAPDTQPDLIDAADTAPDAADTAPEVLDAAADTRVDTGPEVVAPFCGDGTCDPDEDCLGCADCVCPERCGGDVLISEYLEGSSWNKAIEIANFTGRPVDLEGVALWKITNGGTWEEGAGDALPLSGALAPGEVLVVCHASAMASVLARCDVPSSDSVMAFNGDDALALTRDGVILDVIGDAGEDPGTGWAVGEVLAATSKHTLRRDPAVVDGLATWAESAATWRVFELDAVTDLGAHTFAATCEPAEPPRAVLNEVLAGTGGEDFVELASIEGAVDVSGWLLASTGGRYTFPPGATLEGLLAVDQATLGFGLGLVDMVWLYDADGDLQDLVTWTADDLEAGSTWGRLPDASGAFTGLSVATPGAANRDPDTFCGDGTCDPDEDCTSCVEDCLVCRPLPGELVITEVSPVSGALPEWFEVTSLAVVPLELEGLVVRDEGEERWVVDASRVVLPGEVLVFGALVEGPIDLEYGAFTLDEAGDEIVLESGVAVVDRVAWGALAGVWSLSADWTSALGNDDAAHWCAAPDGGSPAVSNPTCPSCGDGTCEGGELCDVCVADCGVCSVSGCATALFISEYVEGSSFNKALELVNLTGAEVDLARYEVWKITNGASTGWTGAKKVTLSGTLAPGETFVFCHAQSAAAILAACDLVSVTTTVGAVDFNGDDAVGLALDGVLIDAVGDASGDPGTGWAVAGTENGTLDHTLRRKPDVLAGSTDWATAHATWQVLDKDIFDGLGAHTTVFVCEP